MTLFTKSIQVKKSKKDGIRICIMRRPDSWAEYDIWMPVLAPSNKLLDDYHDKKINWDQYEQRFIKEVIIKKKKFIEILAKLAKKYDITILCYEKIPKKCHRRLVAEACKKINKKLKIVLK